MAKAQIDGVAGPRVLPWPPKALIAAWQFGIPYWPGGDAVHAPTPLAPPGSGRRTLSVTVHDTVPWTHPETLTPRGVSWHRAVIARAARRATGLVVPTRAVADDLRKRVDVTVPVAVAGHGVAEVLTRDEPVALDLPPRYVLAVGTIEPRKGIDVLIRAMREVDIPLVLVGQRGWGSVDHVRALRRRDREHGCGHRAVGDLLHGQRQHRRAVAARVDRHLQRHAADGVPHELSAGHLAAVLRRATVLAAPSLAEGFGLPVLEAMAAGVPVVHSDAPALAEVAGGAGVCVPRGDAKALAEALREVISAAGRQAELAGSGRARAREFSWERAASAVWSIHSGATL